MKKIFKFLINAVLIFSFFLSFSSFSSFSSNAAFASEWTSYFSAGWNTVTDFFSFSSNESEDNKSDDSKIKTQEIDILPKNISSKWDELTDDLVKALNLRDEQEKLPDSAWFGKDKSSNAKKINQLLDAALKILVQSEAGNVRKEAADLKTKIAKNKAEIDDLRNKKISAPEKSYLIWKLTKPKADQKIAELQSEIQDAENSLSEINLKVADALKNIGLDVDQNQIDILLNSVTGDDLMQNAIIFSNVKSVVTKLEELSKNDNNTFDTNRRYTGMYLILNDLLIHTQEELVKKIDSEYKPGIEAIIKEAQNLQRDALAKSRINSYTETQKNSFLLNADSNALTIRVAKLYISLLNSQRNGTLESIKALKLNRDLAENTYRTVRSSGELRGLIHSGLNLFDSIDALSMPELKPFESEAMRLEFEEINRRLLKK